MRLKTQNTIYRESSMTEYSHTEQLCEEFVRLYGHIPKWKQEAQEYRDALECYPEGKRLTDWGERQITQSESREEMCKIFLKWWKHMMKGELAVELNNELGIVDTHPFYLVTINYPPSFHDWHYMMDVVKTLSSFKSIVSIKHVHEYHGVKENHPHTHMLMRVVKKQKPSELVKMVYQAKGLAKHLGGSNFIDVTKKPKSYEEYEEYIEGDKKDSKLPNVEADKEWRIKNNIC